MAEPYVTNSAGGERIGPRSHRVIAELPHLEVLELSYGPDFEGVDPHTHPDHTDSFYVLEGEVEFFLDGAWHVSSSGTFVSIPPNVEHGFRPCGCDFRLLNIHAPHAGFIDSLRAR